MTKFKRTNAQWREIIAECEASGQTQEQWCQSHGVNLYTYRDRASKLRRLAREEVTTRQSDWVEVSPASASQNQVEAESVSAQGGSVIIQLGAYKLTADAAYPVQALTALLRELPPC